MISCITLNWKPKTLKTNFITIKVNLLKVPQQHSFLGFWIAIKRCDDLKQLEEIFNEAGIVETESNKSVIYENLELVRKIEIDEHKKQILIFEEEEKEMKKQILKFEEEEKIQNEKFQEEMKKQDEKFQEEMKKHNEAMENLDKEHEQKLSKMHRNIELKYKKKETMIKKVQLQLQELKILQEQQAIEKESKIT